MSSMSIINENHRWIELPEKEREVEQRENTVLETFRDFEAQRDAIQDKVQALRGLLDSVAEDAPGRGEIESGLIGLESVGEELEQTYEPILELRAEMLRRRNELIEQVGEDVRRMGERLGRAGAAVDALEERAEVARDWRPEPPEVPEPVEVEPAEEPTVEASSTPDAETSVVAATDNVTASEDIVDIEARVTTESEDNFWAGLDSESGIFISTINLLPLGQRVHVRVDVEGSNTVNAHGVVRWYREWDDDQPELHPGMGIELHELDEAQARVLEDFMTRRDPWLFV